MAASTDLNLRTDEKQACRLTDVCVFTGSIQIHTYTDIHEKRLFRSQFANGLSLPGRKSIKRLVQVKNKYRVLSVININCNA